VTEEIAPADSAIDETVNQMVLVRTQATPQSVEQFIIDRHLTSPCCDCLFSRHARRPGDGLSPRKRPFSYAAQRCFNHAYRARDMQAIDG
jgi:hypothetical protein